NLLGDGVQRCVQTRAETLKERMSIGKANIHSSHIASDDDLTSFDRIQRQIEAAGKVVERSGGNDAERDFCADYFRGNSLNGAVPTGDADPIALIIFRVPQDGAGAANFLDVTRYNISQRRNDLGKECRVEGPRLSAVDEQTAGHS